MDREAKNHPQSRHRSRPRPPQSLESLYSTVESICAGLQRSIDAFRARYEEINVAQSKRIRETWKRLLSNAASQNMSELTDAQCKRLADECGPGKNDPGFLDCVRNLRDLDMVRRSVTIFYQTLDERLPIALDNGVYLYCASLIEVSKEVADEVLEYDDFIIRAKVQIPESVEQLKEQAKRWADLAMEMQLAVKNIECLGPCLDDTNTHWEGVKSAVLEWVRRDREYPAQLGGRISQNREAGHSRLLEIQLIGEMEQHRCQQRKHREAQMSACQKRRRELRNSLAHLQRARRFNTTKLSAYEGTQSEDDKDGTVKSDTSQSATTTTTPTTKGEEDFYKRREANLDKEQNEVRNALKTVEKKISDLEKVSEGEVEEGSAERRVAEIRAEISHLERVSVDCREILLQLGKVQTLLQLQRGGLLRQEKYGVPFHEACRFVAQRVRHDWPRLYLHLPMGPPRSREQRQVDITSLLGFERMNVVLPRNRSAPEDAMAALAKWKLLSRQFVDVKALIFALKSAGWYDWADIVKSRWGEEDGQSTSHGSDKEDEEETLEPTSGEADIADRPETDDPDKQSEFEDVESNEPDIMEYVEVEEVDESELVEPSSEGGTSKCDSKITPLTQNQWLESSSDSEEEEEEPKKALPGIGPSNFDSMEKTETPRGCLPESSIHPDAAEPPNPPEVPKGKNGSNEEKKKKKKAVTPRSQKPNSSSKKGKRNSTKKGDESESGVQKVPGKRRGSSSSSSSRDSASHKNVPNNSRQQSAVSRKSQHEEAMQPSKPSKENIGDDIGLQEETKEAVLSKEEEAVEMREMDGKEEEDPETQEEKVVGEAEKEPKNEGEEEELRTNEKIKGSDDGDVAEDTKDESHEKVQDDPHMIHGDGVEEIADDGGAKAEDLKPEKENAEPTEEEIPESLTDARDLNVNDDGETDKEGAGSKKKKKSSASGKEKKKKKGFGFKKK